MVSAVYTVCRVLKSYPVALFMAVCLSQPLQNQKMQNRLVIKQENLIDSFDGSVDIVECLEG